MDFTDGRRAMGAVAQNRVKTFGCIGQTKALIKSERNPTVSEKN